jgi:hypothetical protein
MADKPAMNRSLDQTVNWFMNKYKSRGTKLGIRQSAAQRNEKNGNLLRYIHSKVDSKSTGNEFAVHITIQGSLRNLTNEIQN